MTQTDVKNFRDENTRDVVLPDGSRKPVRLTPDLWELKDVIESLEGISEGELSGFALEEVELQDLSFDLAYRSVVVHFVNRWH